MLGALYLEGAGKEQPYSPISFPATITLQASLVAKRVRKSPVGRCTAYSTVLIGPDRA